MFELTPINIIHLVSSFCMAFFLGLSYKTNERVRSIARIIWFISVCIVFICALVR